MNLSPEHIHLILNHFPLIGLIAALIPLTYGVILKNDTSLGLGFVMALCFSLTIFPVMEYGESAADRVEHGELASVIDESGKKALEEHEERAETSEAACVVVSVLAFAGLIALSKFRQKRQLIGILLLASLCGSIGLLGWTAQIGGEIRHSEFRLSK